METNDSMGALPTRRSLRIAREQAEAAKKNNENPLSSNIGQKPKPPTRPASLGADGRLDMSAESNQEIQASIDRGKAVEAELLTGSRQEKEDTSLVVDVQPSMPPSRSSLPISLPSDDNPTISSSEGHTELYVHNGWFSDSSLDDPDDNTYRAGSNRHNCIRTSPPPVVAEDNAPVDDGIIPDVASVENINVVVDTDNIVDTDVVLPGTVDRTRDWDILLFGDMTPWQQKDRPFGSGGRESEFVKSIFTDDILASLYTIDEAVLVKNKHYVDDERVSSRLSDLLSHIS